MFSNKTRHRKKILVSALTVLLVLVVLMGKLGYIMIFQSEYYLARADLLHERERSIKASRGNILDTNGVVLASNKTVCTISVIYSQVKDPEKVIAMLSSELGISEDDVRKRVEKVTSIERIKTNVDKTVGDKIRNYCLAGVKVDEDYKRYYPFDTLASKVLGFTGSDNQGIVGLEVKYEDYLAGQNGMILTLTDASGVELDGAEESRLEPIAGKNIYTSIDYNVQLYAQQLAIKALEEKQAKSVSIIVMNPKNGEILAMVNVPEYNLNDPYTLNYDLVDNVTGEAYQDLLNNMWRSFCINDTYEPGSTFKMITGTAALESGAVSLASTYTCTGSTTVEDRRIRCAKTTGHGAQTFAQTVMNSCNPAFVEWGLRTGVDNFYLYLSKLGITSKTGVDLPGEASSILHKKENVGPVELATMSFGQSFQITPLQLLRATSAIINGGTLITPHFAVKAVDATGNNAEVFHYQTIENAIEKSTSDTMKEILKQVVEQGGGINAYMENYSIGGKTATSEKLPRGNGKYISSFIGFVPAEDPQLVAMCIIDEPVGVYYGGTISAPVIKQLFENILPYLNIPTR
ncbi:peptidoglycan D,D-transpeptidase FtsI family protein [[Clostridium] fimetarium]|uniref:Stage V sporulation protein D (Sporulation-specific penicillin-binding protein) n=1 Tax=[Clostridium] fimetarium TaxID=99656 RepID=A0A1I0MTY5_9FIRM|nr:penicillin-binding transpeptidase domain-containing protein [[Clostridium] fimetarium]SEV91743.1 stage V sporulation protein D (sporulation-specific penicillin-binding protein) [[Clostridium] fimetarium]